MVFYVHAENTSCTCKEISLHPGPAFEVVEIVELLGKVQLLRRIRGGGGKSRSLSWTKRMRMLQQRLPLIIIDWSQSFPGTYRQEQNQSTEKCFHVNFAVLGTQSYAHVTEQATPIPLISQKYATMAYVMCKVRIINRQGSSADRYREAELKWSSRSDIGSEGQALEDANHEWVY